jgi:hypothetical protein
MCPHLLTMNMTNDVVSLKPSDVAYRFGHMDLAQVLAKQEQHQEQREQQQQEHDVLSNVIGLKPDDLALIDDFIWLNHDNTSQEEVFECVRKLSQEVEKEAIISTTKGDCCQPIQTTSHSSYDNDKDDDDDDDDVDEQDIKIKTLAVRQLMCFCSLFTTVDNQLS